MSARARLIISKQDNFAFLLSLSGTSMRSAQKTSFHTSIQVYIMYAFPFKADPIT